MRMTRETRNQELRRLIQEQYKDMRFSDWMYPQPGCFSLNQKWTIGGRKVMLVDVLDNEGILHD